MTIIYTSNGDKAGVYEAISASYIGDNKVQILTLPTAVDICSQLNVQPYISIYCPLHVWQEALKSCNGNFIYIYVKLPNE